MILFLLLALFGEKDGVVRAVDDMDYVASDKLGNLVRVGFVLNVQSTVSTYVGSPVSSTYYHYHTSKHVQRTLDNVHDSWARVVYGDGLTGANLSNSCQQFMRFVGRLVFIEPVDLQVLKCSCSCSSCVQPWM